MCDRILTIFGNKIVNENEINPSQIFIICDRFIADKMAFHFINIERCNSFTCGGLIDLLSETEENHSDNKSVGSKYSLFKIMYKSKIKSTFANTSTSWWL